MDNKDTEQHIKDTAKQVFFVKGHLNATMQEIADEAGVNRALLHYYFRKRDKLLSQILKDALEEDTQFSFKIIDSDMNFEQKIEEVVSLVLNRMIRYPYMDAFIVSELLKKPVDELTKWKHKRDEALESRFIQEAKIYIDEHNLPHLNPKHFFVNMMSLCAYPAIMQPLLMKRFSMNQEQYSDFINERKMIITNILLGKK